MAEIDRESIYLDILAECISILDKVNQNEQAQISLKLEIGKKIDLLVSEEADGDAIIKKLARDIGKTRGKIILTSQLYEYRQLYLNFGNVQTIKSIAGKSMTDISTEMLLGLAGKSEEAVEDDKKKNEDLLSVLAKVLKFLTKFETRLEDREFNVKVLAEATRNVELIQNKTNSILHIIRNYGGKNQMDLFTSNTDELENWSGQVSQHSKDVRSKRSCQVDI